MLTTRFFALTFEALAFAASALVGSVPAHASSPHRPSAPSIPISQRHSLTHSHNDYEQPHPLWDALSARMDSVEADIWYQDGQLKVSHMGGNSKGTLEELYLDPLAKILKTQDSVYGDGKPFYLWVEIKDSSPAVLPVLYETLNRYSFLSSFSESQVREGPVTVILTGDWDNKKKFVESYPVRRAVRDNDWISENDPPADNRWQWYAIAWHGYFSWNGYGKIPEPDKIQLEILVRLVHSKGRRVRVYGTPEEEALWNEALIGQIDIIGTDDPARLHRFVTAPAAASPSGT